MQVSNVSNNYSQPNFKGIFRVKLSKNDYKTFESGIKGLITNTNSDNFLMFRGGSPMLGNFTSVLDTLSKKFNVPVNWIFKNAENHNFKLNLDRTSTWIFTGKKSVKKFDKYADRRFIPNLFNQIIFRTKNAYNPTELGLKAPHLEEFEAAYKAELIEEKKFLEFAQKNKLKECSNVKELLSEIFKENL